MEQPPHGAASVANDRVMSAGERLAFMALTVTVILAFTAFFVLVPWYRRADSLAAVLVFLGLVLFFAGAWMVRWLALWGMQRPRPLPPDPDLRVAVVTTFVPDAEPIGMLAQTLEALVALEGAHDTWVLDEGNDPSVAALCSSLGVRHWSRKHRTGYCTDAGIYARGTKYGNYNAWLELEGYANYDVLVAFDSDHIAERGFLGRVLGYFRDPRVAFVQAPQVYYNQDESFIARGAAEETYAFYSIHQMASYGAGHPIIIGCHNTHRMTALREVGGFSQHDADDLVLTLLYRAARWRGVYVPEILALGLTPVSWYDYLRQQVRWSRSVVEVKLRRLPALAGQLKTADRLLGLLHGVYYLRALALAAVYALIAALLLTGARPAFAEPVSLAALAALVMVAVAIGRFTRRFLLDPAHEGGVHWRAALLLLAKWPYQWLAVLRAVRATPMAYSVTNKGPKVPNYRWILWPQLVVSAAMAGAVAWSTARHGTPATGLLLLGLLLAGLPALIVATELLSFPPAWQPEVYARRRARLAAALGPAPIVTAGLRATDVRGAERRAGAGSGADAGGALPQS